MDESDGCARAKLARLVESATWPTGSRASWACPTCARLAEVVLPYLQVLERRVRTLEGQTATPARRETTAVDQLAATERDLIVAALQAAGGVQKHAADALGIAPRTILYRVQKYGLQQYCRLSWSEKRKQAHENTHARRRATTPRRVSGRADGD